MSDVRALLKAKRQEARVTHPFASYSTSGQLRCLACSTVVKHAAAWQGHLGSKAHRTNAARLREEERLKEAEREEKTTGKRKAEQDDSISEVIDEPKRLKMDVAGDAATTREQAVSNVFPADFFSDASRAPLPPASNDSDEDEQNLITHAAPTQNASPLDLEWEKFQQDVLSAPDHRETYERATVMAEAEMAPEVPEGFPSQQVEDTEVEPSKMDEEEARRKKDEDERELIMDRLLDEERAQEEADMKVSVMKTRLEAFKKRREAAKAKVTSSN